MTSPTVHVFVSSTWLDLQPEREALETVAQSMREVKFVGMEYFGSRDETTHRASLDEVDRSHFYIGIIGGRYGSGITEAEYRQARNRKLPCYIYFKRETAIPPDMREQDAENISRLKAELRSEHTVTEFDNPDELAARVTADLHRWLSDNYLLTQQTTKSFHQLPSPLRDFTGREEELNELMRAIEQDGITISGLQGLGGVGKTVLASELAKRLTPRYPDAQFYLDLKGASKTPLSVSDAMKHVIRAYQPTARLPEGEAELSALYMSLLHNQRALLLMDNAANREQVEPLIPPESCFLLITSRRRFTLPGMFIINLDTLPAEDARRLLLKIAPRIKKQADTIAELCDYLPLALRVAASALTEHIDLSVADYVRRLADVQQQLNFVNASLERVDASLSLSYELLNPEMQGRWRVLAIFPDTFNSAAAAAVWEIEPDRAQNAMSELVKYSFVEWDEEIARYRLHDLARVFAKARLSEAERDTGRRRHALHYVGVVKEIHDLHQQGGEALKRALILFDLEWQNIQAGQSWAEKYANEDEAAASMCSNYPNLSVLDFRQHPRERVRWLKSALDAARKLKNRDLEVRNLGNLGNAYWALGEIRRSVEFYEQALAITREIGSRNLEGIVLSCLGVAYTNLGEKRRAIEFYEQSLAISREFGNRRGEGHTLSLLGSVYDDLGETSRAIEFHEQALVIARETGYRRLEGGLLVSLGKAYKLLGEVHRAIEFLEQSLGIIREIGDRRNEGNALGNLGSAYETLGEIERSIGFYEQWLAITREVGDRRGESSALGVLGKVYRLSGETRRSFEFHKQQLLIARELGDRHFEGMALWNMSLSLDQLGERDDAIAHAEASLKIKEKDEDPYTNAVREQLAQWRGQGE